MYKYCTIKIYFSCLSIYNGNIWGKINLFRVYIHTRLWVMKFSCSAGKKTTFNCVVESE